MKPINGPQEQSAFGSSIAQATNGSTAMVNIFQNAAPQKVDPIEVAAAEAFLNEMPLELLPAPSGLPPGSSMPWLRNRSFVGRVPDLLHIAQLIKEGGRAAIGQSPAITGMGGQGKTQLAVEFAYRYGAWFKGGVFWVNCADAASTAESVAACGLKLFSDDAGFSIRPLAERLSLVATAWASELPRLLIFDNCEDEAIIDDWAPKSGACRLLLTARRPTWCAARGIQSLPLGGLARVESVALLRRHRPDLPPDDGALDAIASALGDLPLALELAGRYLAQYRHDLNGTPANYLAELRAEDVIAHASFAVDDPDFATGNRLLTGHERNVARTFELSLRRLSHEGRDGLARDLFARAAWLAPGALIPRHLLKACLDVESVDAAAGRLLSDALQRLLDLALFEPLGSGVVIHRLLAAFGRLSMHDSRNARDSIESTLIKTFRQLFSTQDPSDFRDLEAHLIHVADASARDGTRHAVDLLGAAGVYNSIIADYAAAQQRVQVAISLAERSFGPSSSQVSSLLNTLGIVQRHRGDNQGAVDSLKRALNIRETAQATDYPMIASLLDNLSAAQGELGDLSASKLSLVRSLAIKESIYEPENQELATTLHNLGIAQRLLGEHTDSKMSLDRALAIKQNTYGPDHLLCANTYEGLGVLQSEMGKFTDAAANLNKAIAIRTLALGDRHPDVGRTIHNLGEMHWTAGDISGAATSYSLALEVYLHNYEASHPRITGLKQRIAECEKPISPN